MAAKVKHSKLGTVTGRARQAIPERRNRPVNPQVAILGGGPSGVGAAWQLVKQGKADVTVFEQRDDVGGNAGSFELEGLSVDYGSHRLHPACDPAILNDLKGLLQGELLDRPRHGRIRLRGRWIHFPLKPVDLLLHLPPSFSSGVALDSAMKVLTRTSDRNETFATVLERGLGKTICRDFYFPYARKIWGVEPDELSAIQARRRVGSGFESTRCGPLLLSPRWLRSNQSCNCDSSNRFRSFDQSEFIRTPTGSREATSNRSREQRANH